MAAARWTGCENGAVKAARSPRAVSPFLPQLPDDLVRPSDLTVGPGMELSGLQVAASNWSRVNFTNLALKESQMRRVDLSDSDLTRASLTDVVKELAALRAYVVRE